jgi:hypothetical protein
MLTPFLPSTVSSKTPASARGGALNTAVRCRDVGAWGAGADASSTLLKVVGDAGVLAARVHVIAQDHVRLRAAGTAAQERLIFPYEKLEAIIALEASRECVGLKRAGVWAMVKKIAGTSAK